MEASPRRIFANAHTYHINSISVNSDGETYLSADDLRINLWHMEITDQSFNIVDIKPANMEELTEVGGEEDTEMLNGRDMDNNQAFVLLYSLWECWRRSNPSPRGGRTKKLNLSCFPGDCRASFNALPALFSVLLSLQVITASEFHPKECNLFVYSSSKGTIRLCDMRQAALCDTHAKCKERTRQLGFKQKQGSPLEERKVCGSSNWNYIQIIMYFDHRKACIGVRGGKESSFLLFPFFQYSRSPRTPPTAASSPRSSRPSRTSSSPTPAAT